MASYIPKVGPLCTLLIIALRRQTVTFDIRSPCKSVDQTWCSFTLQNHDYDILFWQGPISSWAHQAWLLPTTTNDGNFRLRNHRNCLSFTPHCHSQWHFLQTPPLGIHQVLPRKYHQVKWTGTSSNPSPHIPIDWQYPVPKIGYETNNMAAEQCFSFLSSLIQGSHPLPQYTDVGVCTGCRPGIGALIIGFCRFQSIIHM